MTIVAFPTSRAREDALCRKLFEAYAVITNAIARHDHASERRARAIYEQTVQDLAALGISRDVAFRRGASA